jgi:hypothetical protein
MKVNKPEDILTLWIDYFNKADVDNLADLYHSNSALIPTFAVDTLFNNHDIKAYMNECLNNHDAVVDIEHDSIKNQKLGNDTYILSGMYTFTFNEGGKEQYLSNFTFIIDLSFEKPILHHHSSYAFDVLSTNI